MLKGKVTHSDKSLEAGLQHSNFVSGTGSANKRKMLSQKDENDNDKDDKDTELELGGGSETEQYQLSEAAEVFIETVLSQNWTVQPGRYTLLTAGCLTHRWIKCLKLDPVILSLLDYYFGKCLLSRPSC